MPIDAALVSMQVRVHVELGYEEENERIGVE
jgi:hypothetical protein